MTGSPLHVINACTRSKTYFWSRAQGTTKFTAFSNVISYKVKTAVVTNYTTDTTNCSLASAAAIKWKDADNVIVASSHQVCSIDSKGVATVLAGSITAGFKDDTGIVAQFDSPKAIAIDAAGNVFVDDTNNYRIRKITPAGVVTTYAGTGSQGSANGPRLTATFTNIQGLAFDSAGNLYVSDGHQIRKITTGGVVELLAGKVTSGFKDETGAAAEFSGPRGIAVDTSGNVFVADAGNKRIRKISAAGVVTTVAGSGAHGSSTGPAQLATFGTPTDLALDGEGGLYIVDLFSCLRKLQQNGRVVIVAGSCSESGSKNNHGASARFGSNLNGVSVGLSRVFILDKSNEQVRVLFANEEIGNSRNLPYMKQWDSCPQYSQASGIAVDAAGNAYIADQFHHVICRVDPDGKSTLYAGQYNLPGHTDGTLLNARFTFPHDLAFDTSGNLFILDRHMIRKIDTAGNVTTVAGDGTYGYVDGPAASARFGNARGLTVSSNGTIYVADYSTVRKIENVVNKQCGLSPGYTGVCVSTWVGDSTQYGFEDGVGQLAKFGVIYGIAFDTSGNLYVADYTNHAIRKVTPLGAVSTLAGNGTAGYLDGPNPRFNKPRDVLIDPSGNILVVSENNHCIRKISQNGSVVSTLAGSCDSQGHQQLSSPRSMAFDKFGDLLVVTDGDMVIKIRHP